MGHPIVDYVRSELEKRKRPDKIEWAEGYLRNQFQCLGTSMSDRKGVFAQAIQKENKPDTIDWELVDLCFEDPIREMQYFACEYLRQKCELLTIEDMDRLKKCVQSKSWWDSVDSLDRTIGSIGLKDERFITLILEWSVDDDFWVRRIAIDHQLMRKEKTDQKLLAKIIVNNFGSKEFFINKAIGWALRDYAKTNPTWVKTFVEKHRDKMAPLSIREATKHLRGCDEK